MAQHSRKCCHTEDFSQSNHDCAESSAWWMLLSHHPPCDLDRTWNLFGVNVCVRCLGMAICFFASFFISFYFKIDCDVVMAVICIIAMVPAGIDFTLGELNHSYPSSNFLRFLTGGVFGVGAGVCVSWCFTVGELWPTILFIGTALFMQLIIAFIFRAYGHLEEYAAKYEDAVARGSGCDLGS